MYMYEGEKNYLKIDFFLINFISKKSNSITGAFSQLVSGNFTTWLLQVCFVSKYSPLFGLNWKIGKLIFHHPPSWQEWRIWWKEDWVGSEKWNHPKILFQGFKQYSLTYCLYQIISCEWMCCLLVNYYHLHR